jgi:2-keto-4-pentenoate hydratase/2-oxohepta-3-ene-1,7-dioic acid hydratase in catechol pathway
LRVATFSLPHDPTPRLGVVVDDDAVVDARQAFGAETPATLVDLIRSGPDAWRRLADRIDRAKASSYSGALHGRDRIRWHAPIPRPLKNVVCLGLNYASHVQETSKPGKQARMPERPVFFTKAPTAVNGPYDPVPWDRSVTEQVDYEVELAVVIGADGRNIARDHAARHIFGYTIVNDVSARDLQFGHGQWFKGKSLDGFCPMGPLVVTSDEFGDPQNKRLSLRVNGETRQDASTHDMIFPIDAIVESLSRAMTIEAGDIIATGTPEGVGLGRTPPEYLKDGDVMEAAIEGIGTLRNQIVAVARADTSPSASSRS